MLYKYVYITKKSAKKQTFCWLGYQDSNLESQDQNLKCYHYTIAQFDYAAKVRIILIVQNFWGIFFQKNAFFLFRRFCLYIKMHNLA